MMRLRSVIVRRGEQLSHDRLAPMRLRLAYDVLSDAALFIRMIKNYRSILSARVVALSIQRRRIVYDEKYFEQLTIRNLLWIELETNHFGMARGPIAHGGIGRFRDITTRITGLDVNDALYLFVHRFQQ